MWQFIKSAPYTFAVAAAILVLAIAGVVWGVLTKGRWKDRGLLKRQGIGDRLVSLRWPPGAFPLTIWTPEETPEKVRNAFGKAAKILGDAAGRLLFMPLQDMPTGYSAGRPFRGHAELSAHPSAGEMQRDHGVTDIDYDRRDGYIISCCVSVPAPVADEDYYPIMLHELGHVLGLDHDEQRESIMFPSLQGRPQALTEGDRKLLRKLYGPPA